MTKLYMHEEEGKSIMVIIYLYNNYRFIVGHLSAVKGQIVAMGWCKELYISLQNNDSPRVFKLSWQQVDGGVKRCGRWQSDKFASRYLPDVSFSPGSLYKQNPRSFFVYCVIVVILFFVVVAVSRVFLQFFCLSDVII